MGCGLLVQAAQLLAGDPHLGPALCNLMSFAQPAAAGQLIALAAQEVLAAFSKGALVLYSLLAGLLLHRVSAHVECDDGRS